jgi:hypothetical protein
MAILILRVRVCCDLCREVLMSMAVISSAAAIISAIILRETKFVVNQRCVHSAGDP